VSLPEPLRQAALYEVNSWARVHLCSMCLLLR